MQGAALMTDEIGLIRLKQIIQCVYIIYMHTPLLFLSDQARRRRATGTYDISIDRAVVLPRGRRTLILFHRLERVPSNSTMESMPS